MLAAVVGLLGGCVTLPIGSEIERPPLWQIDKPDGSTLWLLGTVHWLPDEQQPERWVPEVWLRQERGSAGQPLPLPWNHGRLHAALQRMDRLVLESISVPEASEIERIAREVFEADACDATAAVDPMAAATLPLSAQAFVLNETRPRPVRDVDHVGLEFWLGTLAVLRRVPVLALEDAELRARAAQHYLSDKTCAARADLRDRLLAMRQEPIEEQPLQPRAYVLWRDGDIAALDAELRRYDRDNPELFRALVSGRNHLWLDRIMEQVDTPGNVLVAVGMAHLAGPDNLLELFAERGLAARRLQ